MRLRPLLLLGTLALGLRAGEAPLHPGRELQPFFDDYLLAEIRGVERVAGVPASRDSVLNFDRPWEGRFCAYITVLQDGGLYRLYYRGQPSAAAAAVTCYAESDDGAHWRKPALGLHTWAGQADTNIILAGDPTASENFTPFIDRNPAALPAERYKAVGGAKQALRAFVSPDGLHWGALQPEPVFTRGEFDSQNVAFWSAAEGCYVLYFREWAGPDRAQRTVARTTSTDFRHWTEPHVMVFDGAPPEQLYTNVTQTYYRSPLLSVAFPSRFVPGRQWLDAAEARALAVPDGREKDVSDVVFLTTRGGLHYQRGLPGALIPPGPDPADWVGRSNMVALGLVPLPSGGMGLFRQHHYASPTNHLELYAYREDGIAYLRDTAGNGTILTKPFVAMGTGLWLNFATSAPGSISVEVLDEAGIPLPQFSGPNAAHLCGNRVAREVTWASTTWAQLSGWPVRLRITLDDAELYSLQQR